MGQRIHRYQRIRLRRVSMTPKQQRAQRRKQIERTVDAIGAYVGMMLGVIASEFVLGVVKTQEIEFQFTWTLVIVAAAIAFAWTWMFEHGGDPVAKSSKFWRRVSHAFGQGTSIRGGIELLWILFKMMGE